MHRLAAHTTTISSAEARGQLVMMLTNATDERLACFAADGLARMYRVKAAEVQRLLETERERRAEWMRRYG